MVPLTWEKHHGISPTGLGLFAGRIKGIEEREVYTYIYSVGRGVGVGEGREGQIVERENTGARLYLLSQPFYTQ